MKSIFARGLSAALAFLNLRTHTHKTKCIFDSPPNHRRIPIINQTRENTQRVGRAADIATDTRGLCEGVLVALHRQRITVRKIVMLLGEVKEGIDHRISLYQIITGAKCDLVTLYKAIVRQKILHRKTVQSAIIKQSPIKIACCPVIRDVGQHPCLILETGGFAELHNDAINRHFWQHNGFSRDRPPVNQLYI